MLILDFWELELHVVVNHLTWVPGIKFRFSVRAVYALNSSVILQAMFASFEGLSSPCSEQQLEVMQNQTVVV